MQACARSLVETRGKGVRRRYGSASESTTKQWPRFYPKNIENLQTTAYCHKLAVGFAATILTELSDPKKATHEYLSVVGGKYSQAELSAEEIEKSLNVRASNDPCEEVFSTFTENLQMYGRIGLDNAAAMGQTRFNNDFGRNANTLVSGRKSKKSEEETTRGIGGFHLLSEPLQDSLIAVAKKHRKRDRETFSALCRKQRAAAAEKAKVAYEKKVAKAGEAFIGASYLWQQYHSPRCWKTVEQARDEFKKLKTKKDKLKFVKDQILMRYLGLGWVEAHHPWSKNGNPFTPEQLLEHLVTVVIPLQQIKEVPDHPPYDLPSRPDMVQLGTKAADLAKLDESKADKETEARAKAMERREELESEGFGDQLSELQEANCPIEAIKSGRFNIDMLFIYGEGELSWCQGVVTKVLKETRTVLKVEVKWNKDCVRTGEMDKTIHQLKLSKWNSETHEYGTWRADLRHMIRTSF